MRLQDKLSNLALLFGNTNITLNIFLVCLSTVS